MTLAPIILFVYNRPEHVRRSIESLLRNELAAQSELFIYADAAKDEEAKNEHSANKLHQRQACTSSLLTSKIGRASCRERV